MIWIERAIKELIVKNDAAKHGFCMVGILMNQFEKISDGEVQPVKMDAINRTISIWE